MRPITKDFPQKSSTHLGIVMLGLVLGMLVSVWDKSNWYGFVIFSFLGTGWMILVWKKDVLTTKEIIAWAIIFRVILLPLLPTLSDDAFRYIFDGILQTSGINPYSYLPTNDLLSAYQQLEIYPLLNSPDYFSVYLPVSQLIFYVGALAYDWGWEASYFVIKLIFGLAEVGALILLGRLVSSRNLILYAWNPLVLMEGLGQPHNESLMILFLVASLWFYRKGKAFQSVALLTLAVWTKLYPILLLPFLLNRIGWKYLWIFILLSIGLVGIYFEPNMFANIWQSLKLYSELFEFNAGFYYGVKALLEISTIEINIELGKVLQLLLLLLVGAYFIWDLIHKQRPLEIIFFSILSALLLLSTTIHPWYFLGILLLIPIVGDLNEKIAWHWIWVSAVLTGTYLFYFDGTYWLFIWIGWCGWLVLASIHYFPELLPWIQKRRAKNKYAWFKQELVSPMVGRNILDVGAGEGYLGEEILQETGYKVQLVDVVDFNKTTLPFTLYDGKKMPFENNQFDVSILSFVLHHAAAPITVLNEVIRVSSQQIVILESVYDTPFRLRLLTFLDKLANRVRSKGKMNVQEEHLSFKTCQEWEAIFETLGLEVVVHKRKGHYIHQQALYICKMR